MDFEIKDKNNYFMSQIIVLLFRYKTRAMVGLKRLKVCLQSMDLSRIMRNDLRESVD